MRARLDIDIRSDRVELHHTDVGDSTPSAHAVLPIGSESLQRRELHGDPPLAEELTNAIGHVNDLLDDALRELLPADPNGSGLEWATLVATGPMIETIAAVEIGLVDRSTSQSDAAITGFVLTRDAAEDVFRTLATERRADRLHNPGLPAGEVDEIVGACCIVVAIMRRLKSTDLTVSRT